MHPQLCKQASISSAEMTASHLKLLTVFPYLTESLASLNQ